MKLLFAVLILLAATVTVFSQSENYEFENFTVTLQNNVVLAKSNSGEILYSRKFENAKEFLADLDGDSIPEFCVTTSRNAQKNTFYKVYVYNTVDTFFLADSLESLNIEPYSVQDDETGTEVFIAGNPDMAKLTEAREECLTTSIDSYEFDGVNFILANDKMYDIFIHQNDDLLDSLDEMYGQGVKDCAGSQKSLSLIAAIYLNFRNANEESLALHFMNKYYFCNDIIEIKSKLNGLLKVKKMKLNWNDFLGKTLNVTMQENFGMVFDPKSNGPIYEIVFKTGKLAGAFDDGLLLENSRDQEIVQIFIPYQSIKCIDIFSN